VQRMEVREEGTEPLIDYTRLSRAVLHAAVVPVVIQDSKTESVLFVGYANEQAIIESLRIRRVVLWSTSRNEIWHKGATSGDELELLEVRVNCEQNSLLFRVRSLTGGACHTKGADGLSRASCYYRQLTDDGESLKFLPTSRTQR